MYMYVFVMSNAIVYNKKCKHRTSIGNLIMRMIYIC